MQACTLEQVQADLHLLLRSLWMSVDEDYRSFTNIVMMKPDQIESIFVSV